MKKRVKDVRRKLRILVPKTVLRIGSFSTRKFKPHLRVQQLVSRLRGVLFPNSNADSGMYLGAETTGCSVTDATKTNSHPIPVPSVATLTASSPKATSTAPPLDYRFVQVYLAKEYLRLHIDDNGGNADSDAKCEKDAAKGVLEKKGVKV